MFAKLEVMNGETLYYIVCDLPAVEAQYHQTCSSNFRSGSQIPKHYQSEKGSEVKRGRPSGLNAEKAFYEVLQHIEVRK